MVLSSLLATRRRSGTVIKWHGTRVRYNVSGENMIILVPLSSSTQVAFPSTEFIRYITDTAKYGFSEYEHDNLETFFRDIMTE